MNERKVFRQQPIEAKLYDRVGLPSQISIIVQGRRTVFLIRSASAVAMAIAEFIHVLARLRSSAIPVARYHSCDSLRVDLGLRGTADLQEVVKHRCSFVDRTLSNRRVSGK